mgnify:CR=1 FL=1
MRTSTRAAGLALAMGLLAATAAPALGQDEAASPAPVAPGAETASPLPPIAGVEWLPIDRQTGAEIEAEGSAGAIEAWREILAAVDADFDDLSIDVQLAALEGSDLDYGVVLIARIEGADPERLRPAFEANVKLAMPFDAVITPTRMADKDVLLVEVPPDYRFVYHYAGDAAYQLDLAPDIEESVLAALP